MLWGLCVGLGLILNGSSQKERTWIFRHVTFDPYFPSLAFPFFSFFLCTLFPSVSDRPSWAVHLRLVWNRRLTGGKLALLFLEQSHGGPWDHHPLSNEQVMEAQPGREGGRVERMICVSNTAHMADVQMRAERQRSRAHESRRRDVKVWGGFWKKRWSCQWTDLDLTCTWLLIYLVNTTSFNHFKVCECKYRCFQLYFID